MGGIVKDTTGGVAWLYGAVKGIYDDVYFWGRGLLAPVHRCGRLYGLRKGLPVVPVPLPGYVALCALCSGYVRLSVRRPGVAATGQKKPGQAVQAPPGRKRTAFGIVPGGGSCLFVHFQQPGQDRKGGN